MKSFHLFPSSFVHLVALWIMIAFIMIFFILINAVCLTYMR